VKATLAHPSEIDGLLAHRVGEWLFATDVWGAIAERAVGEVAAYHAAHPLRPGIAREELRSRLRLSPSSFPSVLASLIGEGKLHEMHGAIAMPTHRVVIESSDGPAARLLEVLGADQFAPPSLPDAMQRTGAGPEVVRALVQRGDLVRLSADIAFTREAYSRAVAMVKDLIATDGSVTVAQLRDRMGASRRPVLALLEHLDAEKVTRRVGDQRVLFR
jgi:selenocysteine-specific elongation factor